MEYDEHLQRWWMAVSTGSKPAFLNYGLLHDSSGVRGLNFNGSTGLRATGNGLYYVVNS